MANELYIPRKSTGNDPYMINTKGVQVQVPEERVSDLLKSGFKLVEKTWRPTPKEVFVERDAPLALKELDSMLAEQVDMLEVTEI
jgi:hypothetical protein